MIDKMVADFRKKLLRRSFWVFSGVIIIVLVAGFAGFKDSNKKLLDSAEKEWDSPYKGKKVFFLDSYHRGYIWSDGILAGIRNEFKDKGIELKVMEMDSKRRYDEDYLSSIAKTLQAEIDAFDPDVLICSDDNAFKWVVLPHYAGTSQPVVFCGINGEVESYGGPFENVTGMIEVSLIKQVIRQLKKFAKGSRIGLLAVDNFTSHKNQHHFENYLKIKLETRFVETQAQWKAEFKKFQTSVDLLIIGNYVGLKGWDYEEAKTWVDNMTRIPTAFVDPWVAPFGLLGMTKIPEEQGSWAARAALEIMDGVAPAEIPIVTNKRGKVMINLDLAQKLKIVFPPVLLKHAEFIGGKS